MNTLVLTQTGGILKPFGIILGYIMNYIYKFLTMFGIENIAITIILFTLIVNILLIPLTIKQQKFSKMQSVINPEMKKIQKKYENKKDERSMRMQQAETQAIYDKYGVSPAGGCLPMLVQLPILFALYRVIYNVPAYVSQIKDIYMNIAQPIYDAANSSDIMTQLISDMSLRVSNFDGTDINKIIDALYLVPTTGWDTVTSAFSASPAVGEAIAAYSQKIIDINSFLGGMNLSNAPIDLSSGLSGALVGLFPGVLIPILAGASQWANIKVNQMNQPPMDTDSQMGATMNSMNTFMPLMSVFFCATLPTGIGIYWIASAVFRTVITLFIDKFFLSKPVEEIIEANKEKAAQKAVQREEKNKQLEQYSTMKTKSISSLAGTSVEGKGDRAKSKTNDNDQNDSVSKKDSAQAGKKSVSGYAHMLKKDNK